MPANSIKSIFFFAIIATGVGFLPGPVEAAPVDLIPLDAAEVLQGTIPDGDLGLLSLIYGLRPGEVLNIKTIVDLPEWSANFNGFYLDKFLNVNYSGNLNAYPSGPITWTSSGTYGNNPWSTAGSALFSETPTGFQFNLVSSLSVGSFTARQNVVITAINNENVREFVNTTGFITFDSLPLPGPGTYTYFKTSETGFISDWDFNGQATIIDSHASSGKVDNSRIIYDGILVTVPEPTSIVLVVAGMVAVAATVLISSR